MLGLQRITAIAAAFAAVLSLAQPALAKPPLEAFGDAPTIRNAALSPDGKVVAYLNRINGIDYLATYDMATGKNEALIKIPDVKAGGVGFAGPNYIILTASEITTNGGVMRKYQDSAAFAYNLTTRKIVQLLKGTVGLYPYQSGLGRIVGRDPDGKSVYMPGFIDHPGSKPTYDLLKVNLDTGRGARVAGRDGTEFTNDWFMDTKGNVIAREDYNEQAKLHEVKAYDKSGKTRTLYSETTTRPSFSLVGFSEHEGALIAVDTRSSNFQQMFEVSMTDGKLTGPLRQRAGADIESIIRDPDRVVIGVSYAGMYPSYELFDPQLDAEIKAAMKALPDAAVSLASWSEDWSKVLFYVEGGAQPVRYMMFDRAAKKLSQVARARPNIKPEEVGEVITIEYTARDGLKIPALITWPAGVPADQRKNLPAVVMPHGGPESYDSVGFDWLAQFLSNEGYVVLQPNFRGSGGFGVQFAEAGYKQWGRKMQDDVTDGAKAVQKMGWADANRTCILGWSYGGYAALAGGALTPEMYKCVVSIAGVSDLRSMMGWEKRERGVDSISYNYWTDVIGDPDNAADNIDAVSPARLADKFAAPVLLIHGADDLTVPDRQSEIMNDALKSAGKTVTYLRIGKDDHGLTNTDSRTRALTAVSDFLKQNIGK